MFTYEWYRNMILLLKKKGYKIVSYDNCNKYEKCAILRHDIDTSIEKALKMAEVENEIGVSSTYFVMLRSDFYNLESKKNIKKIIRIIELGHTVGLHFDEEFYNKEADLVKCIQKESEMLSELLNCKIKSFSMHRPSQETLTSNYSIAGMENAYGEMFFKEYKYLSDSRRNWREPVLDIIETEKFDKLQVLTHPFWYNENEKTMKESIKIFIEESKEERYDILNENFTRLGEILEKKEV